MRGRVLVAEAVRGRGTDENKNLEFLVSPSIKFLVFACADGRCCDFAFLRYHSNR